MPLYSWFTQPQPPPPQDPKNFSSYYMYDTGSKRFCRIRLELGRDNPKSGNNNETNISYKANRAVGFSTESYPSPAKGGKWSVNEKFELCYNGTPLKPVPPPPGNKDYDVTVSPGSGKLTGFHPGNATTNDPKLPPGIKESHLTLLAQDAIINQTSYDKLTDSGDDETQLAKAIQDRVVSVLKVGDFSEVNDKLIMDKLSEQLTKIVGNATSDSVTITTKALVVAKDAEAMVTEQINDGEIVPNKELETSVESLGKAITSAQGSTSDGDAQKALVQVESAQQLVTTATQEIGAEDEVITSHLSSVEESLSQAKQGITGWKRTRDEYEDLSNASDVDQYTEALSGEEL